MTRTSHNYYVVMMNHGKRGQEAVVNPETTRRAVVDLIRSGECKAEDIVFIHHVDGLYVEDVTEALCEEACQEADLTFNRPNFADEMAARFDRNQDYRKNWVA